MYKKEIISKETFQMLCCCLNVVTCHLKKFGYVFVVEVYTDHDKVDLLPPSAFETHTVDAAWKELARATNEVMSLKLENQKLLR